MEFSNEFTRAFDKFAPLGKSLQTKAFSRAFGFKVPFMATAGVRITEINQNSLKLSLKNKRKVQNHLGQVHASAMCLLAETATGLMFALHLPDGSLPLMKSMKLDFVKRSSGDFIAKAWLEDEQIEYMHSNKKGEVTVKVILTDEKEIEPVLCEMTWAWIEKRKK